MADNSTEDVAAPLLTMGANEAGFPLAAIYRTRFGRQLSRDLEEALSGDTDPPLEAPPEASNAGFVGGLLSEDDVHPSVASATQELEQRDLAQGTLEALSELLPAGTDPRIVSDIVMGFAMQAREVDEDPRVWYRRIFNRDFFRTRPVRMDDMVRALTEFVVGSLNVPVGARILDVGCGYAPVGNSLAKRGFSVVGLDLSQDMLDMAVGVSKSLKTEMTFVNEDMRSMAYADEFDGAICLDSTFGYFSDAENLVALRAMARALKPGGRLIIDVANRDRLVSELPARSWWEGDGCLIQEDSEFDPRTSRVRIKRLLVFADGRQDESHVAIRLYSAHELETMCRVVGLQTLEFSGSVHSKGAFFAGESDRLFVTAQRPV
ncbi:MAG: class I SAM-dependent methyltransferase [Myxococcota bacterium]|nr:class I SAM-dependent methyltransferase [Myxococcota bacterium]